MVRECRPPAREPARSWLDARQCQLTRQHQAGRARAHDQDIGIRHGHQTAPVVRNGGFQPARVPTEEMSTRMFLLSLIKLRANRGPAILELLHFGPISKVDNLHIHSVSTHSWLYMMPERPAPGALYRSDNAVR
jgi:hypothetical protein